MIIRKIRFIFSYLRYKLTAKSSFKVHSPFVFKFYTEIILDKRPRDEFTAIEKQRKSLLRQRSLLETTDFGSGSGMHDYKIRFRHVGNITRYSSISPKYGKLIHRLVEFNNPEEVLEVGTSLGISTLYIATAAPDSNIVTMEGCAMIAEKANQNFSDFGINNIELVMGNFDNMLEKTLNKYERLDFVLLDGNHRREPTLRYFSQILPKLHAGSMLVIDDIHWSKGMQQAWEEIKRNENVRLTIDLFCMGIVLFKEDIAKEDFVLKF